MNDRLCLEIEREGEVAALIFLYILIVYCMEAGKHTHRQLFNTHEEKVMEALKTL